MKDALAGTPFETPVRKTRTKRLPKAANDQPKTTEKKAKVRRMAFLPAKADTRTAKNGARYIRARGMVTYRRKSFEYTVMVPFWRYARFAEALESLQPIEFEGVRKQVTADKSGKEIEGGFYIEAGRLLGVLDAKHSSRGSEEPSRTLTGHERRGYYRRQHFGEGNSQVKLVWIDAVQVNGGRKAA